MLSIHKASRNTRRALRPSHRGLPAAGVQCPLRGGAVVPYLAHGVAAIYKHPAQTPLGISLAFRSCLVWSCLLASSSLLGLHSSSQPPLGLQLVRCNPTPWFLIARSWLRGEVQNHQPVSTTGTSPPSRRRISGSLIYAIGEVIAISGSPNAARV